MSVKIRSRVFTAVVLATMMTAVVASCRDTDRAPVETKVRDHPGWRMAMLGDSREGVQILDRTVMLIQLMKPKVKMTLHLGDMIRTPGNELEWTQFHVAMAPIELTMPLYAVPGNHDVNDDDSREVFLDQFKQPGWNTYYRVDEKNAHLLFLDAMIPGEEETISGRQLTWLKNQLTALAASSDFKLVFCHYPLFRVGPATHDPLKNGAELHALFLATGVQAVFTSHDHLYHHQEVDGIHYFVTGGAGAPLTEAESGEYNHFLLVTVGRDQLWVQVVDMSGNEVASAAVSR